MRFIKKIIMKQINELIGEHIGKFRDNLEGESSLSVLEENILHIEGISGIYYPHERAHGGYYELDNHRMNTIGQSLPLPPPSIKYREHYGIIDGVFNDELYLKSGKTETDFIRMRLDWDEFSFGLGKNILELGCACGRLLRWFEKEAEECECWGCDVNTEAITWCQQNLSPPFHFFPNTTSPHLPFSDEYFSFIFAGSVFTHIGELADTWFLELRRLLRDDGRIFITIFDEISYQILHEKFAGAQAIKQLESLGKKTGLFDKDYGKFVYSTSPRLQRVGYKREYLVNKLNRWFDVKAAYKNAYGWQSALVLGKKHSIKNW